MRTTALSGSFPENRYQILSSAPLGFRLAKWLQRYEAPGAYRFERMLRKMGYLDVLVRYPLSERTFVDMPIGLPLRDYLAKDVTEYERTSIDTASVIAAAWNGSVTLVDCGADVGLVSAKLVDRCKNIHRVLAFEPNRDVFPFLLHNIESLPVDGKARCAAVADFRGKGSLAHDGRDLSDHGAFLARCENGSVDVICLDDLNLRPSEAVILKIDVEGGELDAVQGARKIIANAERLLVLFEAHRRHARRTGIAPREVMRFILSIRPCSVRVAECPEMGISLEKPFFNQVDASRIYNVCVYTP